MGGGCNPGTRGVTSGDGEDGAPHQPLPGGRGCPPMRAPTFGVGASTHAQHLLQWFVLAGEPHLLDYL